MQVVLLEQGSCAEYDGEEVMDCIKTNSEPDVKAEPETLAAAWPEIPSERTFGQFVIPPNTRIVNFDPKDTGAKISQKNSACRCERITF